MKRRLIIVVFQVDASSQVDQTLEGANVALTRRIMEWRAAGVVFFIQKIDPTAIRACTDFLGEFFTTTAIYDNQMKEISQRDVSELNIRT